jgi:hypothetical protein
MVVADGNIAIRPFAPGIVRPMSLPDDQMHRRETLSRKAPDNRRAKS